MNTLSPSRRAPKTESLISADVVQLALRSRFNPSRLGTLSTAPIILGTSGSGYTCNVVLSDGNAHPGDRYDIPMTYPGTGLATLKVFDSGTTGTVLHTSTDSMLAGNSLLRFVNTTGTQWTYTPEGAVLARNLGTSIAFSGTSGGAISALPGSAKIDMGDSITANPNGAGLIPWDALLDSLSFFNGKVTDYDTAVGGSVIGNGATTASGAPQTVTALAWSSATNVLTLTASASNAVQLAGTVMSVTGTNIPFGVTGTLSNSGTTLTLSASTTGGSGGNATIRLGGNNVMDRLASLVYPHRPAAYGGNGGPAAYGLLMCGANCLKVGETGTAIENDLLGVTGTLESWGITPIVSTILPSAQGGAPGYIPTPTWWSASQETQRELVNTWLRRGNLPGAFIVDSCKALSGDIVTVGGATNWSLFDVNGVHPIGQANGMIARYWNHVLSAGYFDFPAQPEYHENAEEFQQAITLDQGITITSTSGYPLWLGYQPGLATSSYQTFLFGHDNGGGGYNSGFLSLWLDGTSGDPANQVSIGLNNMNYGPITVNANGQVTMGISQSAARTWTNANQVGLTVQEVYAGIPIVGINTYTSGEITSEFLQPNLSTSTLDYGDFVGVTLSGNYNSAGIAFYNAGSGSASNYTGLIFSGGLIPLYEFGSGDVAVGTSADNGYKLEVNGTEKVDGSATFAATLNAAGGLQVGGTNATVIVAILSGTLTSGTCSIASSLIAAGCHPWAQLTTGTNGSAPVVPVPATSGTVSVNCVTGGTDAVTVYIPNK